MRPPGDRHHVGPAVVPMRRLKSAVLGFFAAVMVASLVAVTIAFGRFGRLGVWDALADLPWTLAAFALLLPFALPFVALVGGLLLALLCWRNWNTPWAYAAAGVSGGAIVAWLGPAVFVGHAEWFGENPAARDLLIWYGAGASGGLTAALTFWAIHRPDRAVSTRPGPAHDG